MQKVIISKGEAITHSDTNVVDKDNGKDQESPATK